MRSADRATRALASIRRSPAASAARLASSSTDSAASRSLVSLSAARARGAARAGAGRLERGARWRAEEVGDRSRVATDAGAMPGLGEPLGRAPPQRPRPFAVGAKLDEEAVGLLEVVAHDLVLLTRLLLEPLRVALVQFGAPCL